MAKPETSFPPFLRMIRFFVGEAEPERWYTLEDISEATELEQVKVKKLMRHLVSVGLCERKTRNKRTVYSLSSEITHQELFAKFNRELTEAE